MHHILTHPPTFNYGGILQAFALQQTLWQKGYTCDTIDYLAKNRIAARPRTLRSHISNLLCFLSVLAGNRNKQVPGHIVPWFHIPFKKRSMKRWQLDNMRRKLPQLQDDSSFIVGSDQVWRCVYARNIESVPFFFLEFATQEQRRRSIAYAASFGSAEWEGTAEETEACKQLLQDFKAVSVREHSGVQLCREVFGVEAVQMPDPTLLLEQEDYNQLISQGWTHEHTHPFMATYLLDTDEAKTALVQAISMLSGLYPQQLMHQAMAKRLQDRLPLTISQWLRYIRDSQCVLTDSFHGCVFSIIFNKPFICLGNENRGSARFDSLLGTFGLRDRLVTNYDKSTILQLLNTPIDWERVNTIRHSEQKRAIEFLEEHLK